MPKRISLRSIIVVPFLIQILAVVGMTGWLSLRNGQKSVNDLAAKLSTKISDDIEKQVRNYLSPPQLINQVTASAINSENLDSTNFSKLQRHFWHEVQKQPHGTTWQFGNEKGEYVGVRKEENDTTTLLVGQSKDSERSYYNLDQQGNSTKFIGKELYEPRTRPWYKTAVQTAQPTWTPIYSSFNSPPILLIATVSPIYDRFGKLNGVLSFEFALTQISDFLRKLEISQTGQAFIIERNGEIVATSSADLPFINKNKEQMRLLARNSSNPLIQATAKHIREKFGDFTRISSEDHIDDYFFIDGKKQIIHLDPLDPLKNERGIDWLVVVVIPEADFMGDIEANTRQTILLCIVSLLVAIAIGLQTSKWIVKPILSLNTAAQKLSQGQWQQQLPLGRFYEIVELTKSFGRMTTQLKESFETLEQKVKDRTVDLALANANLEKKNLLIRKVFGRYLTDEIVENLLESPEGLKLGGERRTITILTSDLRGFTAISERLPPEEVVQILNFYLHKMAEVITKYQGTIDEFMGDGILILFGAPTIRECDAVRAVACAVEMQLAMVSVNQKMQEWGFPLLEMGIGINTGEVVVGNIGSDKRTKYGIVGSQVNLTYRIESYTIGGQILISQSTLEEVGTIIKISSEKQVQPKGVREPITIYEVGGIGGKYQLFLPQEEQIFFSLPEAIPIQYTILDGKHLDNNLLKGSLVKLSDRGAEMQIDNVEESCIPQPLVNIKLNLLIPNSSAEIGEDIYAKVLNQSASHQNYYIHFTAKPPAIAEMLDIIYKSICR